MYTTHFNPSSPTLSQSLSPVASPFAISTPIKNMGYPCHFSISNPCRLMEDGGCPPKVRVRMSRYFVGDTFRWSSLIISQASRLWASFPIYSTKEKDVTVYSAETNAHHGHPKRLILYSLPYGLGHPFQLVCKVTQINPLHQTSLLKKAKNIVDLRFLQYLCTSIIVLLEYASSDARRFLGFIDITPS